jgi:solute carrier family 25 phosphate transporter 3
VRAGLGLSLGLLLPSSLAAGAAVAVEGGAEVQDPLERVLLGRGRWAAPTSSPSSQPDSSQPNSSPPPEFAAYLTRFLLHYDPGASEWWDQTIERSSVPPPEEGRRRRTADLDAAFASLAGTVGRAVGEFLAESAGDGSAPSRRDYERLWDALADRYRLEGDGGGAASGRSGAVRQLALLFALLPADAQPVSRIKRALQMPPSPSLDPDPAEATTAALLLPLDTYRCLRVALGEHEHYAIDPPVPSRWWEGTLAVDPPVSPGSFAAAAPPSSAPGLPRAGAGAADEEEEEVQTPLGPVARGVPLRRDPPGFAARTYALLGASGALGCALTHAAVIPLDVVKTKEQVDPAAYGPRPSLFSERGAGGGDPGAATARSQGARSSLRTLVEREGISGLFSGAQATVAGYLWYGLSVYPSYALFKRALSGCDPFLAAPAAGGSSAALHASGAALAAGAMAAVVASLGLAPIEAARIRAVADPLTYRPLGLAGTLGAIAAEGSGGGGAGGGGGMRALYAGLPSLLARQVVFGSVKFLAFEVACEWMYGSWPSLRDATWTCLGVSLAAGGLSGVVSSVVSQPADSVLTYVAAQGRRAGPVAPGLGMWEGCARMVREGGPGSLFRGLGSRCVWAGSIIAGQFLLYDVFRAYLGVSDADLQQVYSLVIPVDR